MCKISLILLLSIIRITPLTIIILEIKVKGCVIVVDYSGISDMFLNGVYAFLYAIADACKPYLLPALLLFIGFCVVKRLVRKIIDFLQKQ